MERREKGIVSACGADAGALALPSVLPGLALGRRGEAGPFLGQECVPYFPPPPQAWPPALFLLPWHRHGGAVFLEPRTPRGHCVCTHLAAEEEPEGER